MKVLITGSTAQQCSSKTASKTPTFSAILAKALRDGGVDTLVLEPSIHMTKDELNEYDKIVVGIAPPTSLSANKVYPAFAVANRARELGKLVLFIDAPEQYRLQASLKSCVMNVADLSKDFYNRRKSYFDLIEKPELRNEINSFITFLYEEEWPLTLFPAFPWSSKLDIIQSLPNTHTENLKGISPDSLLLQYQYDAPEETRHFWTCDSPKTDWAYTVAQSLAWDVFPTRKNRWESEDETVDRIRHSIGTLVSVYRGGAAWWSPALAQSLSCGVPVVTDWRHTNHLGPEWAHLASTVEMMSNDERYELSKAQKASYLASIPTWEETVSSVLNSLQVPVLSK